MYPIPDLSYFAIPSFVKNLRSHQSTTASIFLHNGKFPEWDTALSEDDAYLYTWLHNKTEDTHDIYLPYAASPTFLKYNRQHIEGFINPAQSRISKYLQELGVENIQWFMQDSEKWLDILFAGKKEHYAAAELIAKSIGLSEIDLPVILLWKDIQNQEILVIKVNQEDSSITEYVKSLYWSIVQATKKLEKTKQFGYVAKDIQKEIEHYLNESYHVKEYVEKVRSIECVKLEKSVGDVLTEAGKEYSNNYNNAIYCFEEDLQTDLKVFNTIDLKKYVEEKQSSMIALLRKNGFYKSREGANHEIWQHPNIFKCTPVPRHKKLSPFVIRSIISDITLALGDEAVII